MDIFRKASNGPLHCKSALGMFSPSRSLVPIISVRSKSSHDWLLRQAKDPYVKKARAVSYRARSAFKLLEMDERFKIFKPGQVVVDLGAAPGSWTQVAIKKVDAAIDPNIVPDVRDAKLVSVYDERAEDSRGIDEKEGRIFAANLLKQSDNQSKASSVKNKHGLVIGVDLLDISPLAGAVFLPHSDFTTDKVQTKILKLLEGRDVDVVMSDMAPNATGVTQLDHHRIIELCTAALHFSLKILANNGTFLCKIWTGENDQPFRQTLRQHFALVRNVKPPASRGDSAELFLLGTGFKRPTNKQNIK